MDAYAIKSTFLQQGMTEVSAENLSSQPAVLGFIEEKWRLSGSGNSLVQRKYKERENQKFLSSPLEVNSNFVSSAKGLDRSGIGFTVQSLSQSQETQITSNSGGSNQKLDLTLDAEIVTATLGYGRQASDSLSWGASISAAILSINFNTSTIVDSPGNNSLLYARSSQRDYNLGFNLGLTKKTANSLYSISVGVPRILLKSEGKLRTQSLIMGSLTETVESRTTPQDRFGTVKIAGKWKLSQAVLLHLMNEYQTNGNNSPLIGFDFRSTPEKSYLFSTSYLESSNFIQSSYSLGYVQNQNNVNWGIGPQFVQINGRSSSSSSSTFWAINYVSEISF